MIDYCFKYYCEWYEKTGFYPTEIHLTTEQRDKLYNEAKTKAKYISSLQFSPGGDLKIFGMEIKKLIEPEIIDDSPIYFTCGHEKFTTCKGCYEDFCSKCYERHECYE